LRCGGAPRDRGVVRQQCAVGLVEIDVSRADELSFRAPPTEVRPMDPAARDAIVGALAIPPDAIVRCAELCNGPVWQACDHEVRMLAPSSGMSEDPITGSLNAALARWQLAEGRLAGPRRIAQGTAIGHTGRVSVRPDGAGSAWIGGAVHVLVEGTLAL
jgi:predicted PhzF superfamily epimerase YddE/YHI9